MVIRAHGTLQAAQRLGRAEYRRNRELRGRLAGAERALGELGTANAELLRGRLEWEMAEVRLLVRHRLIWAEAGVGQGASFSFTLAGS